MKVRLLALSLLAALAAACGSDAGGVDGAAVDAVAEVAAGDAHASDDRGSPIHDRCCPAGVCLLGEVCIDGSCHPAPGKNGCLRDGECSSGQTCGGAVLCHCEDEGCQAAPGQCLWPEGCCNADVDCHQAKVCVHGVCRDVPAGGACWTDSQCNFGEVCEDATPCPCGSGEACDSSPGYCALEGACCLTDLECGDGGRCVADRCVSSPTSGYCHSNSDCAGSQTCAGAYLCPCGDLTCAVPTTPGVCTSETPCCQDASECPQTAVCVEGKTCESIPGGNKCYLDGHCGQGRICEGASICACGELCPSGSSVPGSCHSVTQTCKKDVECDPGMRCVIPDTAWCPGKVNPVIGVCVEDLDHGCWSSQDCSAQQRCGGESICTDPQGCVSANVQGSCMPHAIQGDCCGSHKECGPAYDCRNANTSSTCPPNSTAVCLPKPAYGETCWNYTECADGMVCNQAFVCACNARCYNSHPGWCGSPAGQACKTDIDCGTGYACARDEECKLNPCFNSADCPISGYCKPKSPGICWGHASCSGGQFCEGLFVCPTNEICNDPDVAGTCGAKVPEGGCCGSYKACQPGLRCISAATKVGCSLDVSSICVPYTQFNVTCFDDSDCEPSRECVGEKLCACGLAGCEDPPTPGSCKLKQ